MIIHLNLWKGRQVTSPLKFVFSHFLVSISFLVVNSPSYRQILIFDFQELMLYSHDVFPNVLDLLKKRLWNFALKSIPDWHQIGFRSFCSPAEFRFGREKFSKTGLRVMAHLSRWNKPLASRYFNWSLRPSFATMYRKYAYKMDQNNNLNKDFQSVERP